MNDANKLRATFMRMVRGVRERGGGQAVCRIKDPASGAVAGCMVYVEGMTSGRVADAADKIQEECEEVMGGLRSAAN